MKSILNTLIVLGSIFLPIIYSEVLLSTNINSIVHNTKYKTDSIIEYESSIDYKIDSIDTEIKYLNEKTVSQIAINNEILQDKKEELLQLDICLDSISCSLVMEDNCLSVCDTIK